MAINKSTCYWAECDACKGTQDGGDYGIPHFEETSDVIEDAENQDWVFYKEHVWCYRCIPPCTCEHLFGEHEFGEAGCDSSEEGVPTCPCQEFTPKEVDRAPKQDM